MITADMMEQINATRQLVNADFAGHEHNDLNLLLQERLTSLVATCIAHVSKPLEQKSQKTDTYDLANYAAVICMDGEIEVVAKTSADDALDYLRKRAEAWDWEIDEKHPLDRSTATVEQLSELYGHDGDPDLNWVKIATIDELCYIAVDK